MAKKKSHPHPPANGAAPTWTATENESSLKSEHLKALNDRLLKEAVGLRDEADQLGSEIKRIADDNDVLSTMERDVSRLVVSSGLEEIRAADLNWAASVRGSLDAERLAAGEMKRRMELEALEKTQIEISLKRASSERDSAMIDLSERKREFELHEEAAKEEANRLRQHLEQMRDELRDRETEKAALEENLKIAEAANNLLALIEGDNGEVKNALDRVLSEKCKIQKDLAAMQTTLQETEDKLSILEAVVADLRKQQEATASALEEASVKLTEQTIQLEERIQELESKKANLEEQKATQSVACEFLKDEIAKLKLLVAEKKSVEAELEATRAALKSANRELDHISKEMDETKKALEQVVSERDACVAQLDEKKSENEAINGELERFQLALHSLEKEKKRLLLEFKSLKEEFANGLEALRINLELVEHEKAAAADLKAKQETEIAELRSEVHQLLSRESTLQEQLKDSTERNIRIQADVKSAQRDLQLHINDANGLKLQIEELTKDKDGIARDLQMVKAQLNDLAVDSDSKGIKIASMAADKAKLLRELAEGKIALAEVEGQARTAKLNFDKALSLLRNTSEFVSLLEERERHQDGEQELDADVQEFAKDSNAIRTAFKNGAGKKVDVSREVNLLQEAVAEAQNNGSGMWAWLCPAASTVVAFASLAYAATIKGE